MNGPCRFAEALFLRPTVTQIYKEVLSFHNVSVDGYGDDAPGDELATRHSLALGLARSIRGPRFRGGYCLQSIRCRRMRIITTREI